MDELSLSQVRSFLGLGPFSISYPLDDLVDTQTNGNRIMVDSLRVCWDCWREVMKFCKCYFLCVSTCSVFLLHYILAFDSFIDSIVSV